VEVLALERTLTELDHVRLVNRVRRDSRGDGSPTPRLAIAHVLDACASVPSREIRSAATLAGALTPAPRPESAERILSRRVA